MVNEHRSRARKRNGLSTSEHRQIQTAQTGRLSSLLERYSIPKGPVAARAQERSDSVETACIVFDPDLEVSEASEEALEPALEAG